MSGFDIGPKHVGDGAPCLIVAEVAQGHHGSYDLAHAFIDAVADAGADAVKFQCHVAEAESWPDEPWRVKPRWSDETRFEYWKRMEFTAAQWAELRKHAAQRRLWFIASPFSVEAMDLIEQQAKPYAWKVASGELTNDRMLRRMRETGLPVILSTGMGNHGEIRDAVAALTPPQDDIVIRGGDYVMHITAPEQYRDGPLDRLHSPRRSPRWFAVLQCTSVYPCPPEQLGLNNLATLRAIHSVPVGLSDHSGTIYAGLAAVALGCDILEVHVKLSDYDPGPDASSSITVPQLRQLVEGVRFVEKAKQPVDKDALAKELAPMRALFMDRHKRKRSTSGELA